MLCQYGQFYNILFYQLTTCLFLKYLFVSFVYLNFPYMYQLRLWWCFFCTFMCHIWQCLFLQNLHVLFHFVSFFCFFLTILYMLHLTMGFFTIFTRIIWQCGVFCFVYFTIFTCVISCLFILLVSFNKNCVILQYLLYHLP